MRSGWLAAAATASVLALAGSAVGHADPPPPPPAPGPAPTPAPSPPVPGPTTIDKNGTFTVGKDIAPGNYASGGPAQGGGACYWKRSAGDTMVDNALSKKPQVVAIAPTDTKFVTNGCQPWQPTTQAPPGPNPAALLGQLGQFLGPAIIAGPH